MTGPGRALVVLGLLAVLPFAAARGEEPGPFSDGMRESMKAQDALVEGGRYEKVVEEARERAQDGTTDSYYLLGRANGNVAWALRRKGKEVEAARFLERARDAFAKALEVGGLLYPPGHLGLARCALFDQNLPEAARELRKCLDIDPDFRMALLQLAQVEWQRGRHSDAEDILERRLERTTDDVEARMLLGSLMSARKRWPDAEREFRQVLEFDEEHHDARKLLASALMFQRRFEESARHFELARARKPEDQESYRALVHVYRQLKEEKKARIVLNALIENHPGTDVARRAKLTLDRMDTDPDFFSGPLEESTEDLVAQLDSADPAVVERALRRMLDRRWKALPPQVYRLLAPHAGGPAVRLAAVRLIARLRDTKALALLEILAFHPSERDPDANVRREATRAIAALPTPAILLILFSALDDPDHEIREAAVQGIATQTGKYFRGDLDAPTAPEDWAAERERYDLWFDTASGSRAKRRAAKEFGQYFEQMQRGRRRMAGYALHAMHDSREATWRAGYDLFRTLTFHTFGYEEGAIGPEDRARITDEAESWYEEKTVKKVEK